MRYRDGNFKFQFRTWKTDEFVDITGSEGILVSDDHGHFFTVFRIDLAFKPDFLPGSGMISEISSTTPLQWKTLGRINFNGCNSKSL
jgi:hypothetical protein